MTTARPTLYMLCGKIASGKSTLAKQLAAEANAALLSEDHLLASLYPAEIITLEDYARCAGRLRRALGPHIVDLLRCGHSVVLDFQTSTPSARAWMRGLFEAADANHQLHYLEATDAVCMSRLARRNASGTHQYQVSEADFVLFTSHFLAPDPKEGFNTVLHSQA